MRFLPRKKAKPVLGSVIPSSYSLDDAIEKLYERIGQLKSLNELTRHDGWKELETELLRIVKRIDRTGIWVHAADPVKYENEIKAARAARMAILLLLATISRGNEKMGAVMQQYQQKLELMNDLPEPADPTGQPQRSR